VPNTDLPVEDPSSAHVVVRPEDGPAATELTRNRRGMLTSLTVVVPSTDEAGLGLVRTVTGWAPPQFRVDFVVVTDGDAPDGDASDGDAPAADKGGSEVARHLEHLAWAWEPVHRGDASRAELLDRASAVATGEFVVLTTDAPSFDVVPAALGHMWVSAADALLVGAAHSGTGPEDRASLLAQALGLRSGGRPGCIVVLRRWVARFLFNDLGLAIDARDEFEDRVGLLELRLAEILDPAAG
jgi:hypothetical protein